MRQRPGTMPCAIPPIGSAVTIGIFGGIVTGRQICRFAAMRSEVPLRPCGRSTAVNFGVPNIARSRVRYRLQVDSQGCFPNAKPEFLVERDHILFAVKDHLVAARLTADIQQVPDQKGSDAVVLVRRMNGDIFDMPDAATVVDEFRLEEERGRAGDAIIHQGHISVDPRPHATPEDLESLVIGKLGRFEGAERSEKPATQIGPVHQADRQGRGFA
jgi:hypothetical protein